MKALLSFLLVTACRHGSEPASVDAPVAVCGDEVCAAPSETIDTCPEDCLICGDGVCEPGETAKTCDDDCTACGDHLCTGNETVENCRADCSP